MSSNRRIQCSYISHRSRQRCSNDSVVFCDFDKTTTLDNVNFGCGFCEAHRLAMAQVRQGFNRFSANAACFIPSVYQLQKYCCFPASNDAVGDRKSTAATYAYHDCSYNFDETELDGHCLADKATATCCDRGSDVLSNPLEGADVISMDEAVAIYHDKYRNLQQLYRKEMECIRDRLQFDGASSQLSNKVVVDASCESDTSSLLQKRQLFALRSFKVPRRKCALLKSEAMRLAKEPESVNSEDTDELSANSNKVSLRCRHQHCSARPLPFASYCFKHILLEKRQFLFLKCHHLDCSEPVLPVGSPFACRKHSKEALLTKFISAS